MNIHPSQKSTPVLAIIACFLWSTAFVGVKYGLQFVPPLGFAGIRFMLSGLLILPFTMRSLKAHLRNKRFFRLSFLIGLFQTFLLYGLFYNGMNLIPGALGAIVIGSAPLIAAITAHLMIHDDKMTRKKTLSILGGILGVVFISFSRHPWTPAGFRELGGIFLLILSSICSVLGNIIVSKNQEKYNPLLLNAVQLFFGGTCLALLSFFIEGLPHWPMRVSFYLAFGWLSSLSAVAFSIWFVLLKRRGVKVSDLNVWKFIIPIFGAMMAWAMLPDEKPELLSVLGMIFVSISVFFYYRSIGRKTVS